MIINKHFINISAFEYRDMRAWCKERWGLGGYEHLRDGKHRLRQWDSWSYCDDLLPYQMMQWRGEAFFDFVDEKDHMLFCLRWA